MTLPPGGALVIVSNDGHLTHTFADRLKKQFTWIKVITPAPQLTCLESIPMYRNRTAEDVRPRNRYGSSCYTA
ncbi:hypothetical protein Bca4012_025370 [Brassica carinata]